ncbi:MAG: hypothetical protein Q3995_07770 [Eubacteriales bacterium]|nr:hypothetical protein [Eubacteriales bacterium]
MFEYKLMDDYDSSYKVKKRDVACYSKSRMKKAFPDGNFKVIGETILDNKKEKIDAIKLGGKDFTVSKEDSHSSLLFRTVGYVNNGKGEYIALLRRNFLLLWILLGILALSAVLIFFLPKNGNSGILPPDYGLVTEDPNAVEEKDEKDLPDHVIIKLPSGDVEFDMESDTGLKPGETGNAKIILNVGGTEYVIFEDKITANSDGTLPATMLDFTKIHVELKGGVYEGFLVITAPDGTETKIPIRIIIRNSYGGSVTIGYSDKVSVSRSTGAISMYYSHGQDASHDCVLQLILDNGGKEYLLSQSGALHAGQNLSSMKLLDDMARKLTSGVYHGKIRINFYNGETALTDLNTDIEVSITVQ